ncbi:MAG: hypothetical protein KF894_15115 [Labilithrix sp.]|nr:hypothetical protein [Labilithrix sp.]
MKRVREQGAHRAASSMALVGLLGLGAFIANCAEADSSDDEASPSVDASAGEEAGHDAGTVGDGSAAAVDAEVDPCEASEDGCADPVWIPVATGQPSGLGLSSVWGSGPNDVWAVGATGSVIHWDGTTWTSTSIETNYSLQSVYGTGPNDIWVVSTASLIYRSTGFSNGTATFVRETPVFENALGPATVGPLFAVWAAGPGDVWISGRHRMSKAGQLETSWRTRPGDGGVAWAPLNGFGDNNGVYGIWGAGANDVWMVGSKGTTTSFASHTSGAPADGGMPTWTEVDTATFAVLNSICGTGPNDVWAVGNSGTIRQYTGGATWEIVDSPTSQNLRGVWAAATDDVWAVGENGTILHYDGTEWKPSKAAMPKTDQRHLYAVWGSGPADVWAVGDGVVLRYSGPQPGTHGDGK